MFVLYLHAPLIIIHAPGAAVLAAAWIIGRLHLPRIVLWLILLTFLVLMDTGLVGL